jgi:glycosyltransferase involved in cell wall biosynthesis
MKILMATDTFLPRINGVSNSIKTFSRHLRDLGHTVKILAPQYSRPSADETDIIRFPSTFLFFSPEDRLANMKHPASLKLVKDLEDFQPDILHTHTPFSLGQYFMRWGRERRIPMVHTYHTHFEAYVKHYFPWIPHAWGRAFAVKFSRTFCNPHQTIIAPSRSIYELLQGYGITCPVTIIPTGIDLTPFATLDRERMRNQLGFASDDILLLTMGRVAREKNIPFLFKVIKFLETKLPQARLVVAGTGPALNSLRKLSKKMRLEKKVLFLGLLNKKDWADLYAAANLKLLASVTETQGMVLTESMAAGVPCVAVGAMGVIDVMAQGGGLTTTLDVPAFAKAILTLLQDKKIYSQAVQEGLAQAQKWSAPVKAKELEAVYQGLL